MERGFFVRVLGWMSCSCVFASTAVAQLESPAKAPVEGLWVNEEGDGAIDVKIGSDGKLYGVGAFVPGQPRVERLDTENPDPKKRARSLSGARIMWGFVADNKERTKWTDGSIYDPGNGKTYACKLRLEDGALHIRGYVGISLFGRTTVWQRAKTARK